jgi:hypothetical protein
MTEDTDTRRVVIDEPLSPEHALELRDHIRNHADEIGVQPEVIQVE